jgi:hypothetical protein
VLGKVHTNWIENFWSLRTRGLKGTYISAEPFHLFRYLDEQAFRFNEPKGTNADRFVEALGNVTGRRPTYGHLTGKTEPQLHLLRPRQGRARNVRLQSITQNQKSPKKFYRPSNFFRKFARRIIAVPKTEIDRWEAEHKQRRATGETR